jgi:PAS domain S-box-containing protein
MRRCDRCAELEQETDRLRHALAERERERAHQDTCEDLPVACALLDAEGTVLGCNALWSSLLGLDRGRIVGLKLEALVAVPQHVERLRAHLGDVFDKGVVASCEIWLRRTDGAVTPARVQSVRAGVPPAARCRTVLIETALVTSSSRPPASGETASRAEGVASPRATVLVVEDEALVRKAVQHYLSASGYRVLAASDRAGALAACEQEPIDLVLTDLSLGDGATGPEVVEEIRARRPQVGVLYMTACPPELLARRGFTVPVDETLEKPFTKEKLLARVAEALVD